MKKERIDLTVFISLIGLLLIYLASSSEGFNFINALLSALPLLTIAFLKICNISSTKIIFSLLLLSFTALFYKPDTMVDWTSYVLIGVLILVFTLVSTYALKRSNGNEQAVLLKGTFIDWLKKRNSRFLNLQLILLNFTLIFLFFGIISYFIFSTFNLFFLFITLLVAVYSSFSDIYYLVVLPNKKRG